MNHRDLDRWITGESPAWRQDLPDEPAHQPCEGEGCDECEGTGLDLDRMREHREAAHELRLERGPLDKSGPRI